MSGIGAIVLILGLQSGPSIDLCTPATPTEQRSVSSSFDHLELARKTWRSAQVIGNRCFLPDGNWCWTNPAPVGDECYCDQTKGRVRQ